MHVCIYSWMSLNVSLNKAPQLTCFSIREINITQNIKNNVKLYLLIVVDIFCHYPTPLYTVCLWRLLMQVRKLWLLFEGDRALLVTHGVLHLRQPQGGETTRPANTGSE